MTQKEITDNIRERLNIEKLNSMQLAMQKQKSKHIVLLAPTGSGKTVGFALQLLRAVGKPCGKVQAVVIAPSRELVIQTAEVLRRIAVGLKVSALYGGHSVVEEKATLSVAPDIVVATPGRLLDHMQRDRIDVGSARALVLDEYDKSLELGFQDEMSRIVRRMRSLSLVILTSATELEELPSFVDLGGAATVDFRGAAAPAEAKGHVEVKRVLSVSPDKLDTLSGLLASLAGQRVIVFVNYRDAAERVYNAMKGAKLPVGLYHGGLDQIDRDKAIVRFNNGTTPVLIATDLGSRGLDIDDVNAVVHYHMPSTAETWTHRNGRTGRMGADGRVYVIESANENVPEYVVTDGDYEPAPAAHATTVPMATLFFDAGKKDKISRGDIVGYLCQQGGLTAQAIGKIDLRDRFAYVAVPRDVVKNLLKELEGKKIKGKKVRISEAH